MTGSIELTPNVYTMLDDVDTFAAAMKEAAARGIGAGAAPAAG